VEEELEEVTFKGERSSDKDAHRLRANTKLKNTRSKLFNTE
jgi:hypothetical protein